MPIELTCKCGRALNLRDELAGMLIRCPGCSGTLQVPIAAEQVEIVEAVAAGPPPLPQSKRSDVAAGPPPLPKSTPAAPAEPPVDLKPPEALPPKSKERRKKKKRSVYSQQYGDPQNKPMVVFDEGWFGNVNGGMIGGTITLLVGVGLLILFLTCGGLIRGVMFAIILIIVGLIGILKGLHDMY
jgi:hypothetical protein